MGKISAGQMAVNSAGQIVKRLWDELPLRYPRIKTDAFVIMPNHVHGIIIVGAQFIAPSVGLMNRGPTLGEVIRGFKAVSTREIRKSCRPEFVWQRNYYDHIIRHDDSLNRIREYIWTNPVRWDLDKENSAAKGKDNFDIWLGNIQKETFPLISPKSLSKKMDTKEEAD